MRYGIIRKDSGFTLIELLVALVVSSALIAALYRTLISQQKTYSVQEQVAETQQNLRVAIDQMTREIRMAGYGKPLTSNPPIFPMAANGGPFNNVINPVNDDQVTIIGAFKQVSTLKAIGTNTIELNGNASEFDSVGNKSYICVGGLETHRVTSISGNTLTLDGNLVEKHSIGAPVFKVKAITYRLSLDSTDPKRPVLTREDNTDGGGSEVIAENIENLQFTYFDGTGNETAISSDIQMVRVTATARTDMTDSEYKGTDGYRRRQLISFIKVRNLGL